MSLYDRWVALNWEMRQLTASFYNKDISKEYFDSRMSVIEQEMEQVIKTAKEV